MTLKVEKKWQNLQQVHVHVVSKNDNFVFT